MSEFVKNSLSVNVQETALDIEYLYRKGSKTPIVFLHGFGSTKEDYADIMFWPAFDGHPVLAYDAPGFGQSRTADPTVLSIPFLVETAKAMLDQFGIEKFHLIGHSMGGLTGLLLAHEVQERVLSFTDIEGNVAPEDCFLSRQIVTHWDDNSDAESFMKDFADRNRQSPFFSHHLYAASLSTKVQDSSPKPIFTSMVELSDGQPLIDWFVDLPGACCFMHGDQNAGLSYLDELRNRGVTVAPIPHSGHFPMYANAPAMWAAIATNVQKGDG
jgi:pimeloyl-ACP methyl ester carboxylesterase